MKRNDFPEEPGYRDPDRPELQPRHSTKKKRQYSFHSRKRLILILILLAVFLFSAVSLIVYAINSAATQKTNRELQAIHENAKMAAAAPEPTELPGTAPTAAPSVAPLPTSEAEAVASAVPVSTQSPELPGSYQYTGIAVLPEMDALLTQNRDTVAWLNIPGVVDLPVVYRNNEYYLDHDFYGKQNKSGCLFLDESHPLLADTQYLVIHGHNMKDGTMFGVLSHYRNKGFMQEHPKLTLTTLYREDQYEVIGVLYFSTVLKSKDHLTYTGMRKFPTSQDFDTFAKNVRMKALYWKNGAEMTRDGAYLALSTCDNDEYRIVVLCKRLDFLEL